MSQTILITAGEASGDRLGAALMAALKAKRKGIKFIGVGGPEMEKQGLESAFPMADLAIMGLFEVLPAIPRILARISQLAKLAREQQPILAIHVDSQEFSYRLAKRLRRENPELPILQYVAPKVWAWRQERVKKFPGIVTHLLTILPFEEKFFAAAQIPATYVGHPAVTTLAPYKTKAAEGVLALLPGSRKSEIKRHWPVMLATYRRLRALNPHLIATLALPDERALTLCRHMAPWHLSEHIYPIYGEARFPALAKATAALAKSGTINLELAILGVPSVVIYKMNPLTHWLAKRLVKVPFISLPNLILGKAVFPEYIQAQAAEETLTRAVTPLLNDTKAQIKVRTQLTALHTLMKTPTPPAQMAAAAVLKYLK